MQEVDTQHAVQLHLPPFGFEPAFGSHYISSCIRILYLCDTVYVPVVFVRYRIWQIDQPAWMPQRRDTDHFQVVDANHPKSNYVCKSLASTVELMTKVCTCCV